MVKLIVYYSSLLITLLTLTSTILTILSTNLIRTSLDTAVNFPHPLITTYGLFKRCDSNVYQSNHWNCRKYPDRKKDCVLVRTWIESDGLLIASHLSDKEGQEIQVDGAEDKIEELDFKRRRPRGGSDWGFCDKWITAGYLSLLSLVFSLASFVSIVSVLISGSRIKREDGWKLIAIWTSLASILSTASFMIVIDQYRNDWRFTVGGVSRLGTGIVWNGASWISGFLFVGGLVYASISDRMKEDTYRPIYN